MAKKDDERARRLAAALRENLKRRKAQAREAPEGLRGKREEAGAPTSRHPGESRDD